MLDGYLELAHCAGVSRSGVECRYWGLAEALDRCHAELSDSVRAAADDRWCAAGSACFLVVGGDR